MAEGSVDISHSLVWAERIHRWWTTVPASVRVVLVAVISGWLGALSDQPLQMKVFLAVATTIYAAIGFMLISDALSSWLARLRDQRATRDVIAKYAVAFHKLAGRLKQGQSVEAAAIDTFNQASVFLEGKLGYTYAAKLKMADTPSKESITWMSPEADLHRRLVARKEYLELLIDAPFEVKPDPITP